MSNAVDGLGDLATELCPRVGMFDCPGCALNQRTNRFDIDILRYLGIRGVVQSRRVAAS